MRNALTVDVEDWYMTNGLDIDPSRWSHYEDRVERNTRLLLDIFDSYGVKGTFFVLGCVAEKHPALVEDIARKGHEIGSHGGWHRLLTRMSLEQFREDLVYSKRILEGITGKPVTLFRAPSWSVVPGRYEVLRILRQEGFECDSSMQPFKTPLSGVSGIPVEPFEPELNGEPVGLVEYPPTVVKIAGMTIPFSGGFYLRAVPYPLIRWALATVNGTRPGMIYVHPWELDEDMPRVEASPFIKLIQYYGIRSTKPKLEKLLREFSFVPLGSLLEQKGYARKPLVEKAIAGEGFG